MLHLSEYNHQHCQLNLFDGYAEAAHYHGGGGNAKFALMQRLLRSDGRPYMRQDMFSVSSMADILRALRKDVDTFISQGEFRIPRRRLVNLSGIGLSFADLDTYKVPFGTVGTHEWQAERVVEHYLNRGLPSPSLIVSSGRGLQVKWFYDGSVPFQGLPRWNAVQRYLTDPLREYGLDTSALDASRLLRVVGTVNTRSGTMARVVWAAEGSGPGGVLTYGFDELAHSVLPYTREELNARRAARDEARRQRQERLVAAGADPRTAGLIQFNARIMWLARYTDFISLADLRGWNITGTPIGSRNDFLFLIACSLAWSMEPQDIRGEVDEIARRYCPDLSRSEVRCAALEVIERAWDASRGGKVNYDGLTLDPRYRWSNQSIIERLHIEPDEERHLTTIISEEERRNRHRRRNRKEMDRNTYRQRAAERKAVAMELRGQGLTIREIAARTGVSERSVVGYLQGAQSPAYVYGEA